jgi:hypothetical protein
MENLTLNSRLAIINSIIDSTGKLIPMAQNSGAIQETVFDAITEILSFLDKIVKILPEILLSGENFNFLKQEIIKSIDNTVAAWDEYDEYPGEFAERWQEFHSWWDEFYSTFNKIAVKQQKTIWFSLN